VSDPDPTETIHYHVAVGGKHILRVRDTVEGLGSGFSLTNFVARDATDPDKRDTYLEWVYFGWATFAMVIGFVMGGLAAVAYLLFGRHGSATSPWFSSARASSSSPGARTSPGPGGGSSRGPSAACVTTGRRMSASRASCARRCRATAA
jgi:hypothetical protein